jgi:2-dehydropantoate 2-reductase
MVVPPLHRDYGRSMEREHKDSVASGSRPLSGRPRIAVVGSGAVGAYYGGRLAQHGHDVHFLVRGDFEAVKANGWTIRSCDGDFVLPPGALNLYDSAETMPCVDLVLVTLKTTSNEAFGPLIGPLLGEGTCILTIQNGLGNEDRLAQLFGAERILGGMAFVCINRIAPGVIHHIEHGLIRLGEFAARGAAAAGSARAEAIAALFRGAGIRCQAIDDLRRGRWEKLVWNVPFNGLGAVLDWTTDRLIATERGRALVEGLMREVIVAARADGADLAAAESAEQAGAARGQSTGSTGSTSSPQASSPQASSLQVNGAEGPVSAIISRQIEHTQTMGAYMTSMQIDRREGRPLEVESILGEPLRRAREARVETPILYALYELASLVGSVAKSGNACPSVAISGH